MINAQIHILAIEVIYAAVAIPLSGWAGLWSVIFLAEIATIRAGIERSKPPQTNDVIASTKASTALV